MTNEKMAETSEKILYEIRRREHPSPHTAEGRTPGQVLYELRRRRFVGPQWAHSTHQKAYEDLASQFLAAMGQYDDFHKGVELAITYRNKEIATKNTEIRHLTDCVKLHRDALLDSSNENERLRKALDEKENGLCQICGNGIEEAATRRSTPSSLTTTRQTDHRFGLAAIWEKE